MSDRNKWICSVAITYAPLVKIIVTAMVKAAWYSAFGFPPPF